MTEQPKDGGPIHRWLVFNIGCIECGVSSNVVKTYADRADAEEAVNILSDSLHWREGGQNAFQVFDLWTDQSAEYADAMLAARGAK